MNYLETEIISVEQKKKEKKRKQVGTLQSKV